MFSYNPLPPNGEAIRLVSLAPAKFDSPIQCSVFHSAWSDSVSFEALSYTWGELSVTTSIYLDSYEFPVTVNLESALRHLRSERFVRVVWIDAICLNQADDEEKASQIPLMNLIYQRAKSVVVWLGPSSHDSALAHEYVCMVNEWVDPGRGAEITYADHFDKWPMHLFARLPLSLSEETRVFAFYRLLARPWWRRAWIRQEISMSEGIDFQWGHHRVSWVRMQVALHVARTNHHPWSGLSIFVTGNSGSNDTEYNTDKWPSKVINNALAMLYARDQILEKMKVQLGIVDKGIERPLSELSSEVGVKSDTDFIPQSAKREFSRILGMNRGTKCYWPHDRIYSILGIIDHRFRSFVKVSYAASEEMFYCSIVRDYISVTNGCLDIILQSQHSIWHQSSLPSWVPDWGKESRASVFHHDASSSWLLSQVFIKSPSSPYLTNDLKGLIVQAVPVGKILSIGLEFEHILQPEQPYYNCEPQDPNCPKIIRPIPRQTFTWWERRDDRAADALGVLADFVPKTHPVWRHHIEAFLCAYAVICISSAKRHLPKDILQRLDLRSSSDSKVILPAEDRTTNIAEINDAFSYLTVSRTLAQTEDDRLILALDAAEAGDVVYCVAGCSNAIVLRPRNDGTFMFIGDCFVMGMDSVISRESKLDQITLT